MAIILIVSYDISDDKTRSKCAALLQTVGDRIQKSVYLCMVDDDELAELQARITEIINPQRDLVAFYRQCQACWQQKVSIGLKRSDTIEPFWAVF